MNWLRRLQRWRIQRQLRRHRIPLVLWEQVVVTALTHFHLSHQELHRLRELASLFLQEKTITGAGGHEVDDEQRALIAAQACLLILNLGLDWYEGWQEIIVYPGSFVVQREEQDELGLVHEQRAVLGGEAWGRGPVILAWDDARPGSHPHGQGSNVILHEFAHKLDMLNGKANGMPPLHKDMDRQAWTQVFSRAFEQLQARVQRHHRTCIDPYGAENPAEFFAVVSEEFFMVPDCLHRDQPALYGQLQRFYHQDPLQRLTK
ncbi:MAG TPA: zinc-dependent peptidase [Gammaproteobacteria bacterium]|nr:zinc-dependent peptidase [Gammaproteobacteria bacterium]